jgi:hypothetical protein
MTRTWPILVLAVLSDFTIDLKSSHAQVLVTGGLTKVVQPATPKIDEAQSLRRRRRWRDRNPYFVARPIYPPAQPGTRPPMTLEPYTSKYYPTGNSYYPPLPVVPSTKVR